MADNFGDVDFGESFGQRRPPLYKMIKNILHEYPSGQIFKEIIQNADDARATEVKFYLDYRSLQTLPPGIDKKGLYSGPALLSYNNASFKKEDWESIQNLHDSSKAKNPHKVGKFGIGFNSVYNITDLPVILSEDYCGFLEPQENVWKNETGKRFTLKSLQRKCSQVLEQFNGIMGFTKLVSKFSGKTFLRFPLRKKPSKLCDKVYDASEIHKLLESLKEEAQYLLVYLRSVCSVEVSQIDTNGIFTSIFKVNIESQSKDMSITQQRKQFLQSVEATFSGQRPYDICTDICLCMITLKVNSIITSQSEWLVVNQVGSEDSEVIELAEKQSVLPWVGTAVEISSLVQNEGRIFCVLPLPVEDRVPFRVHVNGTFAVSNNRRSLKWEVQERKGDEEGKWNNFLVSKCLPSCYFRLVVECVKLKKNPDLVYECWPNIQLVSRTPFSDLLEPFYRMLLHCDTAVHTLLDENQWISVSNSVFIKEIPEAVRNALLHCNVNLVEINTKVSNAISTYYKSNITQLRPFMARSLLKCNPSSYEFMSSENKMAILKYCLSDHAYHDIIGLYLLPLANNTFQLFQQKKGVFPHSIYLCTSDNPSTLLPGVEKRLVNVYDENNELHLLLESLANSGSTQLTKLDVSQVANLLSGCNTITWSNEQMRHFWKWLENQELTYFQGKQIVPVTLPSKVSSVVPLRKQGGVLYIPHFNNSNPAILTGLAKCDVSFADANRFTYLTHLHLSQYLYQLKPDDVLEALSSIKNLGNVNFTAIEAKEFQNFFSAVTNLDATKIHTIRELPLFFTIQGSGSNSVQYSINSIATSLSDNKAIAKLHNYEFRKDLLPLKPLVINTKQNNFNFLINLQGNNIVEFLDEIDYLDRIAFSLIEKRQFHNTDIVPFMTSVLDNFHKYQRIFPEFRNRLKNLPFVEDESNSPLVTPCSLYDPENKFLKVLMNKFPGSKFKSYLPILRQCGLRSSLTGSELFQVIKSVQKFQRGKDDYIATVDKTFFVKIKIFFEYICLHPEILHQVYANKNTLINTLISYDQKMGFNWLPITDISPSNYPSCLTWKGSKHTLSLASTKYTPMIALTGDINLSDLPMVAGSQAVFIENVPNELTSHINSLPNKIVKAVLAHFHLVIEKTSEIPNHILKQISVQTYKYLFNNLSLCDQFTFKGKWIWIDKLNKFFETSQVAIENNPSFITSLEPFIFTLPSNLSQFIDLFTKCGVSKQVTVTQIVSVLQSIKGTTNLTSCRGAWSIIKAILDWLVEDTKTRLIEGVLVPVESSDKWPQLLPLSEVTYTDNEFLREVAKVSDEKEYYLVHPKVRHLSSQLGLTPLSDHLDITEDVFEDAGQHEPLVTRLSNILREYKDGLTIIKEMIQNADDAGATEVNILYDNRTHSTENLLFKGMGQCHGPALIVHNNSTFTKEDFENITKLAGATKANQPLKIGKFGVGFCSVYHITDVPSFVSGEWLYIFDPTLKYLKGVVHNETRPGKKIKYQSKFFANSKQLIPYVGLFNFSSTSTYNGTMFRLPFRTSSSQISSTIYSDHMIDLLQLDLKANGSQLLLFLQSVKKITFSCMNGNKKVRKLSIECQNNGDLKKFVINSSTEYWLVSCIGTSLQSKPVKASVACHLMMEKKESFQCQTIDGAVFCFLPLGVPSTGLPVHISANFAVMSNRSGIWTSTTGVASDSREAWNQQLMETVIPKAYCNLLIKLRDMTSSGKLSSYDFHFLWPLEVNLKMRHPWNKLISSLYKLLSKECLFYSVSADKWLTLDQSIILSSSLYQNYISAETLNEIVNKLNVEVVSLPEVIIHQLEQYESLTVKIITQVQFTEYFLKNISLFTNISLRNDFLFGLFLLTSFQVFSESSHSIFNLLAIYECVPCSPDGVNLKLANSLIDPNLFQDMFDPEDGKFPLERFYKNKLSHQAIIELGLMTNNLPWNMIIDSAETVQGLFVRDKKKALLRVAAVIRSIKKQQSPPPPNLKEIPFLPVLQKPRLCMLPWEGEGKDLLPSSQVIAAVNDRSMNELMLLVGSQQAIVNTRQVSYGGCGKINESVLTILGIKTYPLLNDVLNHFKCLISQFQANSYDDKASLDYITSICRNTYEFLNNELLKNNQSNYAYTIISSFMDKKFIWNGKAFIIPVNVSRNWKINGPYLFKLPDMLSEHNQLTNALNIWDDFDIQKLLNTLTQMYKKYGGAEQIPCEYKKFIDYLMSDLNDAKGSFIKDQIILIDICYILRPVNELAYNDAQWLPVTDDVHLIHKRLTREKALELGVKTIRSKCLDGYVNQSAFAGIKFGQREELTQRIKNILRDYPLDATFLKELLQNADDAKATKMCVILDKRQHGTEKLLSKEWEELQGPAVLVWNDKDFSDKDLEGIQRLGLGSKRDDDESIGQFGIGFNVVYHLTDSPSFITREGSTLCVFDPHCKYVPGANKLHPGRQYDKLDNKFWADFKDLRSCYLLDTISGRPSYLCKGSLFRFPLRSNQNLVDASELVEENDYVLTSDVMDKKLSDWVSSIEEAFLFLNHIRQFEFYVIENNEIAKFNFRASYSVSIGKDAIKSLKEFHSHQLKFKETNTPKLVTYSLKLSSKKLHNNIVTKDWIVQQGIGDTSSPNKTWHYKQVLPKHGISVPLEKTSFFPGKVFCFLPLSIKSNLPVHINGQFVLSSNRRSLWVSGDDETSDKAKWNTQLIEALASSYVHFLVKVKDYFFKDEGYQNSKEFEKSINWYYSIFPYWQSTEKPITSTHKIQSLSPSAPISGNLKGLQGEWLRLAKLVFQMLKSNNMDILAIKTIVENFIKVKWTVISDINCPFSQAYFTPEIKDDVISILKKIGMTLTCAPLVLQKHIDTTPIATPYKVFSFYKKFHKEILECPFKISLTEFQKEEIFYKFLKYLLIKEKDGIRYVFPGEPYEIPLLLTADGYIRYFHRQVYSSQYADIFPKSSSIFLHPCMLALKMSHSYFIQDASYHDINKLFMDNFSSTLHLNPEVNNQSCQLVTITELKHLWKCISHDPIFSCHQSDILNDWALIPSTKGYLYKASSSVKPICPLEDSTLLLPVFKLLSETLTISILNFKIHKDTFKYCPNISDYDEVSRIIYSSHMQKNIFESVKLERTQIEILLSYLSKTSFRHNENIKNQIKSLPIFLTKQGVLTSLLEKTVYLWPSSNMCIAGYEKWALLDNVVFLERNGSWTKLCGSDFTLLGERPDEICIYSKLIFPNFDKLTPRERMDHLKYIRDFIYEDAHYDSKKSHQKRLVASIFIADLVSLKCLPYQGKLETVASFCDHTIEIFTTFSDNFRFLSEEYRDKSWIIFFHKLGLQTTVSFEMFLSLAEKVSKGTHNNLEKASDILLSYLFSPKAKEWHDDNYIMNKIGDVSFVKVAKLNSYSWIKVPCSPPNGFSSIGLTKLNQAVISKHSSLVWTVRPVVHLPDSIPSTMRDCNSIKHLGICTKPIVKDVYDNIINISKTGLADFHLFNTYKQEYVQSNDRANLEHIIIDNLKYLQDNDGVKYLKNLSEVSCIPVSAVIPNQSSLITKPVLVKPIQVVLILDEKDIVDFAPFIHKATHFLYKSLEMPSLELMNVYQSIDIRHIKILLATMQSCYPDGIITVPNEIITITKAINKLKRLLYNTFHTKKEIQSQLQNLCLPTQIDNVKWKLVSAEKLIFSDTTRFDLTQFNFTASVNSLFKIPPESQTSSFTKKSLEKEFCLQLPKSVRPIGLSLCTIEHFLHGTACEKCPLGNHFKKLKQLSGVIGKIIVPLIEDPHLNEKDAKSFTKKFLYVLNEMKVIAIRDLHVNLQLINDHVDIGSSKVDYSLQSDSNRQINMYVDEETTPSPSLWDDIAQSFCIQVGYLLKVDPLKYFRSRDVLKKLLAVQKVEELEKISEQDLQKEIEVNLEEYIPKVGKLIPPMLVAMLSQDINHIYRPQEFVGYTIQEDQYIWAMVLYSIDEEGSNETQLKRYAIAYNEMDDIPKIVSAVDLYKFIAREHKMKSEETALVLSQVTSANTLLQDARTNQNLLALKRKICKELKLIWSSKLIPEEKARAIRRIYINYHPDKVFSNKDLYEEAFKFLKRQIDRLENGQLPLEEPEEEIDEDASFNPSSWHDCYETWDQASRRPCYRYEESGGERVTFGGLSFSTEAFSQSFVVNPDPEEATRWLRQAHSDLEAMKILCKYIHKSPVSCQVIFLAHEVLEKCLKAGMYKLVGINPNSQSLKSHNLTSHAYAISSQRPGQLEELPKLTTSMEDSYLDTRFPNRHEKPKAPVDIFRPDEANLASDIAKKIYKLIELVIKGEL